MKPLPRPLAMACLASSMLIVGCYVALSKPLAAVFPVFLLGWLRFGIAGVAMLRWLRKPAAEPPLSRRTHVLIFLEAFLGSFLFTIFMVLGVSLSSAVAAGVILSAIPAAVALLSRLVLREEVQPSVWFSIVLGVSGIVLLALARPEAPGEQSAAPWLGYALLGCTVLCEASYAVIGKKLTAVLSPKRISAMVNLWGFLLMLPAGLATALHFDFTAVPWSIWVLLVFYALAASIWTVWLWMTGLREIPASRAGMFTVMLPIGAATVGIVFLGEPFTGLHALAFAMALGGLLLASVPSRRGTRRA